MTNWIRAVKKTLLTVFNRSDKTETNTHQRWIKIARELNATHIVSVCDVLSGESYPAFVMPGDDLEKVKCQFDEHSRKRIGEQKINEVIEI